MVTGDEAAKFTARAILWVSLFVMLVASCATAVIERLF
jgi:hypothetical protein